MVGSGAAERKGMRGWQKKIPTACARPWVVHNSKQVGIKPQGYPPEESTMLSWTIYASSHDYDRAMECARGGYQRALLAGTEAWSGSTLSGSAKEWSSKYRQSRDGLVERMQAAGIRCVFHRAGNRRVLVVGDTKGRENILAAALLARTRADLDRIYLRQRSPVGRTAALWLCDMVSHEHRLEALRWERYAKKHGGWEVVLVEIDRKLEAAKIPLKIAEYVQRHARQQLAVQAVDNLRGCEGGH